MQWYQDNNLPTRFKRLIGDEIHVFGNPSKLEFENNEITLMDVVYWHRTDKLMRLPGVGKKTVIQVLQSIADYVTPDSNLYAEIKHWMRVYYHD